MTTVPVAVAARPARIGLSFVRVVRSEWIKARTVRSTVWTLALTVVLMVGINTLISWGISSMDASVGDGQGAPGGGAGTALMMVASAYGVAQLTLAVLGVLAITTEYSTGMIRSTLAAVPRRLPAMAAKALVLLAMAAATSVVAVALSWVTTLGFQSALDSRLDLGDADTRRILLGVPLYLATIALFGFAIGTLVRRTAGAVAVVLGLLLVVEPLLALVPVRFFEVVGPFLPGTAGARLLMGSTELGFDTPGRVDLTAWQGYGVLAAWTVLLLAVGALLLRRRDA